MSDPAVPILRTPRLTLRPPEMTDAPAIAQGVGNYDVSKWLAVVPYPYGLADAEQFLTETIEDQKPVWMIEDQSGLIGTISVVNELGYWLARPAWRKGYGLEAAKAVVAHWFTNPEAGDLASGYFEGNARSGAVLRALGFREVGLDKRNARSLSQEVDCHVMRLTRADWQDRQDFTLRTERLTIRPLTQADDAVILPLGHIDVARQTASVTPDWTRRISHRWLRAREWTGDGAGMFGVFLDGTFIGAVGAGGYPANAGWMLVPQYWGNGYATEALRAFLPAFIARTTDSVIHAEVYEDNTASRRVAEKLGFQEVGRGMGTSLARLDPAPVVQYRLTRDAALSLRTPDP